MAGQSSADFAAAHVCQHPLQAFSTRYFAPQHDGESSAELSENGLSGSLSGLRQDYAQALNQPAAEAAPFIGDTPPEAAAEPAVSLDSFLNFWSNPVRHWLRRALQWQRPYADRPADSAEPYAIERSDEVKQRYLDARRHREDFAQTEAKLQADSLLPAGLLGEILQEPERTAAKQLDSELLASPREPDFPFRFEHGGHTFVGSLTHLHQHGQIFYRAAELKAPAEIGLWLQHLVYCAVHPQAQATHLVSLDSPQTLPPLPQAEAAEQLARWFDYYLLGQQQPLPLLPRTSLAAAKACTAEDLAAQGLPEAALKAARSKYRDSRDYPGQNQDPEVTQVYGRDEDEPINSPLFARLVLELLAPLYLRLAAEEGTGKKAG